MKSEVDAINENPDSPSLLYRLDFSTIFQSNFWYIRYIKNISEISTDGSEIFAVVSEFKNKVVSAFIFLKKRKKIQLFLVP